LEQTSNVILIFFENLEGQVIGIDQLLQTTRGLGASLLVLLLSEHFY
jgi:hypothetical protein